MILCIDVNEEDILMNEKGRLVVRLHYYSHYATAAHLHVTKGNTLEEFERKPVKKAATLFIGSNGGISHSMDFYK